MLELAFSRMAGAPHDEGRLLACTISCESERPYLRRRRLHQLPGGGENGGDGFNVFGELLLQAGMQPPRTDE